MAKQLINYLRLPWRHKLTAVHVTARIAAVRFALSTLPYATVKRAIDRLSRPRSVHLSDVGAYRKRVLQCITSVARNTLGAKPCLTQALVAQWMLGRTGFATDLKFGVSVGEEGFEAHAWLEKDGRVLLGGSASPHRYTTLQPVTP